MLRRVHLPTLLGIVCLLAVGLVIGTLYLRRVRFELHARAASELEAVARLEARQVEDWVAERAEDARVIAASPAVLALSRGGRADRDAKADAWLRDFQRIIGYRSVSIIGRDGAVLYTAGGAPPAAASRAAREALRARWTLCLDDLTGDGVSLVVAAPIAGAPEAALVLETEVEHQLIRVVEQWPTAAHSAEVELIRVGADDAVILSRIRGEVGEGPAREVPISDVGRAAARAVRGERGTLRGRDYRGAEVLAVAREVQGLHWLVLAKVDRAEIDRAEARVRGILIAGGLVLLALCAATIGLVFKARSESRMRQLWETERSRVNAERAARQAAQHAKRVVESVSDGVVSLAGDGRVTGWNQGAERIYGWSAEEALGCDGRRLLGAGVPGTTFELVLAPDGQAHRFDGVVHQHRKDGTSIFVDAHVVPLDLGDGAAVGRILVARDVTSRQAAEAALRSSEERLQQVVESTKAGVWDLDLQGGSVYVSPAWNRMLGYAHDTVWDRRGLVDLVHPDDRPLLVEDLEAHLRNERPGHEVEVRMRAGDGAWRWVHTHGRVVERGPGGEALRMVGADVDVTERREFQARLLIADRMSSMGVLAAGVAHEINNPLSYVLSNVAWAIDRVTSAEGPREAVEELRGALTDAHEGATRVRDIVRDLRSLSEVQDDGETAAAHLGLVVESTLQLARGELKRRASVETEIGAVPPVVGSASRLGQVVLNLVLNAAQAIPPGSPELNRIRIKIAMSGSSRVAFEISDTGCGISPAQLPRIFDPFFTTKRVGEGSGLGLSIAHAIVIGLGGEIWVESALGKGSTFTVLLPCARTERARDPEPVAAEPPARRGRILVVDDERQVGSVVRRMLEPHHDVVTVSDARSALDHVERAGCDVIISDVLMPDMTGLDLRRRLAVTRPALAGTMIFMTGSAFSGAEAEALSSGDHALLEKPFSAERLLGAVARALA